MSHLITSPLVLCAMCHSPLTCWLLLPGGHFGTKIFLFLPYFPFCQTTPLSKYPWHNLLIFGSCLKAGLCSETCKILGTDQHMFSRIPQPLLLPKVQQRGTEVNPPFVRSRADGIPVQAKKMLFLPPVPLCPQQMAAASFAECVRCRDGKKQHPDSLQSLDTDPRLRTRPMLWPKLSSHPNPFDERITFSTRSMFFILAWLSYPALS